MKNIIIVALLACTSLMAAESVPENKPVASSATGIDGAKLYKKKMCSMSW
jgi:hypothetical protein